MPTDIFGADRHLQVSDPPLSDSRGEKSYFHLKLFCNFAMVATILKSLIQTVFCVFILKLPSFIEDCFSKNHNVTELFQPQ